MPRTKLALPASFPFSTEIAIRIGDINYGGHVGNDSVLTLAHEARMRFLASFGQKEADVFGAGIIMADAVVVYQAEAFWGDVVIVDVAIPEVGDHGCDMVYRLTRKADGREIARIKTGMVFFNYGTRRIMRTPEEFRRVVTLT